MAERTPSRRAERASRYTEWRDNQRALNLPSGDGFHIVIANAIEALVDGEFHESLAWSGIADKLGAK